MAPHDPVRYDFALTGLEIREDTDITSFLDAFSRNTGKMRGGLWIGVVADSFTTHLNSFPRHVRKPASRF
jgi:hypothetical protein